VHAATRHRARTSAHQATGDLGSATFAQCGLGVAANGRGEHATGDSTLEAALAAAREIDDRWVATFTLHYLAASASQTGDIALASSLLKECIELLEHLGGNKGGVSYSRSHLGRLARPAR
jgi:hypothetical protein